MNSKKLALLPGLVIVISLCASAPAMAGGINADGTVSPEGCGDWLAVAYNTRPVKTIVWFSILGLAVICPPVSVTSYVVSRFKKDPNSKRRWKIATGVSLGLFLVSVLVVGGIMVLT